MKSNILVITILLLTANAVFAQNVEAIEKRYAKIAEMTRLCESDDEQGEIGELVMNTLAINSRRHQWRAVGIYSQTLKFFYNGGNSERHPYPDKLVFVKSERRISDRTYNEEYLFSEAGVLIFYLQKAANDDQVPIERRVYIAHGKAIHIVEDRNSRFVLTTKDNAVVKEVVVQSENIKAVFKQSIKL